MDVVLTILALLAGGLIVELFAAARAPEGYQDESGFHFGTPVTEGSDRCVLSNKGHKATPAPQAAPSERPLAPATMS